MVPILKCPFVDVRFKWKHIVHFELRIWCLELTLKSQSFAN
jgi:hypothetical protein